MEDKQQYPYVVFAGGGNRCTWQAGFWDAAAPALGPLKAVVGVSAGAYMACALLAGRSAWGLEYMKKVTAANPKNFYWENLLNGGRLNPHAAIYRRCIMDMLTAEAMERLRSGPEVRILMAHPPAWAGSLGGVLLGFLCYTVEKWVKHPLHPQWAGAAGFTPRIVSAAQCQTPGELADAILASSCTPPFIPAMQWEGKPVLDGGLIDNVPVAGLGPEESPALVLLSRRYDPAKLTGHKGRTYIQPSAPMPVGKWDYTDPDGMQAAYDLGLRDGERFLAQGPAALQK